MTKNMTLSLDDALAKKMDEMKEINWSQVARDAFAIYIESRDEPEIGSIKARLSEEKNNQYANGFSTATNIAKKLPYEKFASFFTYFDGLVADEIAIRFPPGSTSTLLAELVVKTKPSLPDTTMHEIMIKVFRKKGYLSNSSTTKQYKRGFYDGIMKFKGTVGEE